MHPSTISTIVVGTIVAIVGYLIARTIHKRQKPPFGAVIANFIRLFFIVSFAGLFFVVALSINFPQQQGILFGGWVILVAIATCLYASDTTKKFRRPEEPK